ncbi:hypothetical protein KJ996_03010 [Patescibacteria group bacterium]|nr:hypothetical protein [Patescibacteria group bacterium]
MIVSTVVVLAIAAFVVNYIWEKINDKNLIISRLERKLQQAEEQNLRLESELQAAKKRLPSPVEKMVTLHTGERVSEMRLGSIGQRIRRIGSSQYKGLLNALAHHARDADHHIGHQHTVSLTSDGLATGTDADWNLKDEVRKIILAITDFEGDTLVFLDPLTGKREE